MIDGMLVVSAILLCLISSLNSEVADERTPPKVCPDEQPGRRRLSAAGMTMSGPTHSLRADSRACDRDAATDVDNRG